MKFLFLIVVSGLMINCSSMNSAKNTGEIKFSEETKLSPAEEKLVVELAKANNLSLNAFDCENAKLLKSDTGYNLEFSRNPGEGRESCKGNYRKNGTLENFECDYQYSSHSMDEENRDISINAVRHYDEAGKLNKVSGNFKEVRIMDNKILTERDLKSPKDEVLAQLTKPLMKLNEAFR